MSLLPGAASRGSLYLRSSFFVVVVWAIKYSAHFSWSHMAVSCFIGNTASSYSHITKTSSLLTVLSKPTAPRLPWQWNLLFWTLPLFSGRLWTIRETGPVQEYCIICMLQTFCNSTFLWTIFFHVQEIYLIYNQEAKDIWNKSILFNSCLMP